MTTTLPRPTGCLPPVLLDHVVDDPGETRDLAGAEPALLDRLVKAWHQYADEVGVIPGHH